MAPSSAPPRHVLMTADTVGGVWTYAVELAARLATSGTRTTLATMGEPLRPDQRSACSGIAGLRVFESAFRLEWMDDPWDDVARAGEWLLALEASEKPDVVHLNGYAHAGLPWLAPRLVVAHSCVLSWWTAVFGEHAPAKYDRYRLEVGRGLRFADAIVAPTCAMLQALRTSHGITRPGRVIPNGVDAVRLRPGSKEPLVLAAGRLWDAAKNLAVLEAAAPQLRWAVYAAGAGREPEEPSGAPPALRYLGRLSPGELHAWMARAAIYAFPARYEPFGLSVLEAALSGCALVLGDIPSLREVWSDAALYVAPGDVDALVAAIERLASEGELRQSMAIAARRRGLSFSASRMAASYLELYGELRARRAGSPAMVRRCG